MVEVVLVFKDACSRLEQPLIPVLLRVLRKATNPEEGHRVIASVLPPQVASALGPAEYELMRQKLVQLPEPPARPQLHKKEWLGAIAVFLWVFFTTFPVATPFLFMDQVAPAMRVSNAIAIVMLFLTGHAFGRVAEYRPWLTGFGMVVLGCILVGLTIALGG